LVAIEARRVPGSEYWTLTCGSVAVVAEVLAEMAALGFAPRDS
jgi:hypothetical protein